MRPESLLLAVALATFATPTVSAQPQPAPADSPEDAADPEAPTAGPIEALPVTRCVVGDLVGAFHQTSQLKATDCYRDCETEHRAWLTLPGFAKPVLELSETVDGYDEESRFVVTCRKGRVSVGVRGLDPVPLELDRARGRLAIARSLRREIERAFAGERNVDPRRWPASLSSMLFFLDRSLLAQVDLVGARAALRAGNWASAASGSSWAHGVDAPPGAGELAKQLADEVRALRSKRPVRLDDARVVSTAAGSDRHVFWPLWSGNRLCLRVPESLDGVRCGAPPTFALGAVEPRPAPIDDGWRTDTDASTERAYVWHPDLPSVVLPGEVVVGITLGPPTVVAPGPRALMLDGTRLVIVGAEGLVDATAASAAAFLAQSQGTPFIGNRWIVHEDDTGEILNEPPGLSVSSIAEPGHEWRLVDGATNGIVSPDGRWISWESSAEGWDTLRVARLVEGGAP